MQKQQRAAIEQLIEQETGDAATVDRAIEYHGGCISLAYAVTMSDGRRYFVKSNPNPLPGLFESEAKGLRALRGVGVIRVPKVVGTRPIQDGLPAFIVMEMITTARPGTTFSQRFGAQLARFHQASRRDRFGFDEDNYVGSTPQANGWADDWCEFWREQRLGYMLRLTQDAGVSDATLDQLANKLQDRLVDLIGQPHEPACLLHGDLWDGNFLADDQGDAVLIDPAVYYGRREAELAMSMLFGGFDDSFFAAYNEAWPLAAGSEQRIAVYQVYHLLNHMVIFGRLYRDRCVELLRSIL